MCQISIACQNFVIEGHSVQECLLREAHMLRPDEWRRYQTRTWLHRQEKPVVWPFTYPMKRDQAQDTGNFLRTTTKASFVYSSRKTDC